MIDKETLPKGWSIAKIGEVCEPSQYGYTAKAGNKGNYHFLRTTDITKAELDWNNVPFCEISDEEAQKYLLKDNDVVISRAGSIGYSYLISKARKSVFASYLIRFRPLINPKYFRYFLDSQQYWNAISEGSSGIAVQNVNAKTLSLIELPIAPEKEQNRIVEKLDELFSELDAGVTELQAAQIKLKHYRQSLLKSAVEGALTQKWRDDNKNKIEETGKELLNRILIERKQRWEQQKLAEFKEKGKKPPKNWQDKYPEPIQPDTTDLPELPDGWIWASMSQISQIQGGIQKQPKRRPVENKYPFLRVANVYRNELRLDEIHEIELFEGELQRLALLKDDILIVEGNGSKSEIGRCAIWNNEIENAVHQNHLIRTRPVLALSKYVALWLNSPAGMDIMSTLAATTSGLYTLSVSKISKIPVPIPSLCEQQMIADIIDTEFDSIDRQVEATTMGLIQSEAQRKNILKSAFSGEIVPQNENEEPASVLLEKIEKEREELAKQAKPKRNRQPKKKVDVMSTLLEVLTAEDRWIDAQEAFKKCGIVDGTPIDRVEEIYAELRKLEKSGQIEIDRNGSYDQLRFIKQEVKED
ncbi:restriction endonuclease subunit S [Pseudoalteromonas spongiae]|uniref:restriction endonuclease subunit S n=1 Tax=Pseudoalteromonas spongiae TaxID=298657 RepID=UPI00110BE88B|nr:restriction endonuclease subunit S [Pseudoalteromonas spongiae]TMO84844.1 restriction endonuclease subunit S [Pseudoalteromonas spongiae]